jgi:enoyl-CoA hydratase/carnithine racemase
MKTLQLRTEGPLLVDRLEKHIALITLNRPEARNALNIELAEALNTAANEVEADDNIWVAILTGSGGKAFASGADLKVVLSSGVGSLFLDGNGLGGFTSRQRSKVWIAAVEGFALAGGLEIALACDMIVASENSSFGLPEVKRGLIAAAGGIVRLPAAIPSRIAFEMISTGDSITAARAYELGLINKVVATGTACQHSVELAGRICQNAPLAVRQSLLVARQVATKDKQELDALCSSALHAAQATDDFSEGLKSFIEKRNPVWSGT